MFLKFYYQQSKSQADGQNFDSKLFETELEAFLFDMDIPHMKIFYDISEFYNSNILKELISPPSTLNRMKNAVMGRESINAVLPDGTTSNIPWRKRSVPALRPRVLRTPLWSLFPSPCPTLA